MFTSRMRDVFFLKTSSRMRRLWNQGGISRPYSASWPLLKGRRVLSAFVSAASGEITASAMSSRFSNCSLEVGTHKCLMATLFPLIAIMLIECGKCLSLSGDSYEVGNDLFLMMLKEKTLPPLSSSLKSTFIWTIEVGKRRFCWSEQDFSKIDQGNGADRRSKWRWPLTTKNLKEIFTSGHMSSIWSHSLFKKTT